MGFDCMGLVKYRRFSSQKPENLELGIELLSRRITGLGLVLGDTACHIW